MENYWLSDEWETFKPLEKLKVISTLKKLILILFDKVEEYKEYINSLLVNKVSNIANYWLSIECETFKPLKKFETDFDLQGINNLLSYKV